MERRRRRERRRGGSIGRWKGGGEGKEGEVNKQRGNWMGKKERDTWQGQAAVADLQKKDTTAALLALLPGE